MTEQIRAVFADPQVPGLEGLYDAINAARGSGSRFRFPGLLRHRLAGGGPEAEAWINFTVNTAMRFSIDQQPDPDQFLAVLEEVCDRHRGF